MFDRENIGNGEREREREKEIRLCACTCLSLCCFYYIILLLAIPELLLICPLFCSYSLNFNFIHEKYHIYMHTQVLYRLTAMHKLTETTTPMHILVNASMSRSDSLSFPHFPVVKTLQRPSVGRSEEMLRAKQVGQVLRALVDFATKHDVFEVPWDVVRTGLVGPSFSVKEEGDPPSFG